MSTRLSRPLSYPWTRRDSHALLLLTNIALITRFIGLHYPTSGGTPIFDEKHYVPQAWDMVRSWSGPFIGGIESNPGYGLVVHPPLAKQLLALSEFVFGYTPLGWRTMTAACGTAVVVLIYLLARQLSGSWQVASFAAVIAICDGVLLVSSRFGMLDIFQVFFILAAAYALARDHDQQRHRLWQFYASHPAPRQLSEYGPRFGFRWWRFGAGVMLGMSLAIKWSGLYYMAFFGVMTVLLDAALRARYRSRGLNQPFVGAIVRDSVPGFASLVILPVAIYTWSWRAWFASETAVYRHARTDGTISETSPLHFLPDSLAGWLHYHFSVLEFHASLTSSAGHSHPWDSKPWSWLVASRPVLYYSVHDVECAFGWTCTRMLYLFGTPIIWWLIVPAVAWGLWSLIIRRNRRFLIPLVGAAAGFLPWLAAIDRQMYFFYAAAFIPFIIIIIALTLGQLSGSGPVITSRWLLAALGQRELTRGTLAVISYLAAVIAMFIVFSPILYGYTIPQRYFDELMWLPSWR